MLSHSSAIADTKNYSLHTTGLQKKDAQPPGPNLIPSPKGARTASQSKEKAKAVKKTVKY